MWADQFQLKCKRKSFQNQIKKEENFCEKSIEMNIFIHSEKNYLKVVQNERMRARESVNFLTGLFWSPAPTHSFRRRRRKKSFFPHFIVVGRERM